MIYDIDITERVIGGLTQQSSIVQHNVAVDHIRPHFDAEWDGFAISAIFEKHAQGRLGELKFSMSASDGEPTVIPWELLEDTRDIQLAFVGIKEGERLVTLYSQATLTVRPSGEITGATPKDPTVDQIEAAIAEVREAAGSATAAASKATSAAASANTAKDNADNATRAANDAASAANTAKSGADAAAKEATSAAKAANDAKAEVDAAMETFRTISSVTVDFAPGDSASQVPAGGWASDPMQVGQGKWLWTRTTIKYNQGADSVSYSAAYQGVDGNVLQQAEIDALTAKTDRLQNALDSVTSAFGLLGKAEISISDGQDIDDLESGFFRYNNHDLHVLHMPKGCFAWGMAISLRARNMAYQKIVTNGSHIVYERMNWNNGSLKGIKWTRYDPSEQVDFED